MENKTISVVLVVTDNGNIEWRNDHSNDESNLWNCGKPRKGFRSIWTRARNESYLEKDWNESKSARIKRIPRKTGLHAVFIWAHRLHVASVMLSSLMRQQCANRNVAIKANTVAIIKINKTAEYLDTPHEEILSHSEKAFVYWNIAS